jgi:hypothetical protein
MKINPKSILLRIKICKTFIQSVFHCSNCSLRLHKQCLSFVPKVCGMATDDRRGKINISAVVSDSDRIKIIIRQAKNLSAMDNNGKSDPYVKVSTSKTDGWSGSGKTKIKKRSLSQGSDFPSLLSQKLSYKLYCTMSKKNS